MSQDSRRGGGNGSNGSGFDDFDDFIRDREPTETEASNGGHEGGYSRGGFDPYADFAGAGSRSRQPGFDRGLVDGITRILESLGSVAGDSLSPETRRQLERALRDLLVVLRDVIDAMIERIDNRRRESDFEMENIPID
ncbi:MAG: hypothetical protein JHD02_03255 [Thermoleophilaceae bacterium]|nr:hypothetical protein [Thermoleophilaceae bacterium]